MIKVLIVDDEQFVRVAFRTMYNWEENGFCVVDTAVDGLDALKKMEQAMPDVVITDIVMPNMDGIALLEEIQNRGYPCVPVVLSNLDDFYNVRSAMKLGARDYFLKVDYEYEEFHKVMCNVKKIVQERRSQAVLAPGTALGTEDTAAMQLCRMIQEEDYQGFHSLHIQDIYCIRPKSYSSKALNSFDKAVRPISNIIKELFNDYAEVSTGMVERLECLLVVCCCRLEPSFASGVIKRLDGQLEIYLQLSADILHFSGKYPDEMVEKCRGLPGLFSPPDKPRVLLDDDDPEQQIDDIQRVKNYVAQHLGIRISLADIAEYMNLNASYLSRIFKERTGVSVVNYITEEKMKRAAVLLKTGDYKIKEVAELLGIEDQYYFNKLFKKVYGISPTEFLA